MRGKVCPRHTLNRDSFIRNIHTFGPYLNSTSTGSSIRSDVPSPNGVVKGERSEGTKSS
jgi:hypothetical protein